MIDENEKFNVTPKGTKAPPLFLSWKQIKFLAKNWPEPPVLDENGNEICFADKESNRSRDACKGPSLSHGDSPRTGGFGRAERNGTSEELGDKKDGQI